QNLYHRLVWCDRQETAIRRRLGIHDETSSLGSACINHALNEAVNSRQPFPDYLGTMHKGPPEFSPRFCILLHEVQSYSHQPSAPTECLPTALEFRVVVFEPRSGARKLQLLSSYKTPLAHDENVMSLLSQPAAPRRARPFRPGQCWLSPNNRRPPFQWRFWSLALAPGC